MRPLVHCLIVVPQYPLGGVIPLVAILQCSFLFVLHVLSMQSQLEMLGVLAGYSRHYHCTGCPGLEDRASVQDIQARFKPRVVPTKPCGAGWEGRRSPALVPSCALSFLYMLAHSFLHSFIPLFVPLLVHSSLLSLLPCQPSCLA